MIPPGRAQTSVKISDEGFGKFFREAYINAIGWHWYLVTLLFLVVLTIACRWIPLLNILAYEFSVIIGLVVCHVSAALVIREINRIRKSIEHRSPFSPGPHPRLVIWGVVLGSLAAVGWLLLVPLAGIIFIDLVSRSIRNCDLLTGFEFYLTIPFISSFFGAALGTFCSLATSSRRNATWFYIGLIVVFFLRLAAKLGWGHTIGFHDPIIGLFNLPMYDQEANLDMGFVYSRLFLMVASGLLITFSILFADRRFQTYSLKNISGSLRDLNAFLPEVQTVFILGVLFILGLYYQGPLGIDITRRYLENVLDGRVDTEHFIIRYPTGGEVEDDIERIAEDHEFYYWSIVNDIGVAPDKMLRAYIYPDRQTKTFLTGVGSGVYAKPWTGEIHVQYSRNRISSLKHELVHILSSPMGLPIVGIPLYYAYGEGIAEGVQWDTGNDLTYHQWTAALREAIDPYTDQPFFPRENAPLQFLTGNLKSGGFLALRRSMSYYLSASHTRWFLDTYGAESYARAYISNNTSEAIGLEQEQAAEAWMEYLDHVPLREEEIAFALLGFSPPRFEYRVCAHELAEHERLAGEYTDRSLWIEAYNEYSILLDYSPENIRYGYQQARMLYYQEEFEAAFQRVREIGEWESAGGSWETYLALLEGDIHARSGRMEQAAEVYSYARDIAHSHSYRESAIIRLEILNSPALDEFLAAMRDPDDSRWYLERAKSLDDGWLPLYFLASNLMSDRLYEEASELYSAILELNPPFLFVERSCLFSLGICAYRNEDYVEARRYFQDAGVISSDLFIEEHPSYDGVIPLNRLDSWSVTISDWLSRCEWRESWPGIDISDDE